MKVSTEIDDNFGYEKITQLVDNIPLSLSITHVKLVVLCGYSVKFVNCSCKVGGFMWILC